MPYKHQIRPLRRVHPPDADGLSLSLAHRARSVVLDEAFDAFALGVQARIGADNVAAVADRTDPGRGWLHRAAGRVGWRGSPSGARRHGILFVADEVQTGFARTGDWFACDYEGVVPDLITTAKGMAGGMPLAGVTGRAEVMDEVHGGGLGGTYGGNPVACAAAMAAIETMREDDLCARARGDRRSTSCHCSSRCGCATAPSIGDIRGRGAMLAVELVTGGRQGTPNAKL
jgi:4-aminobutyrate aminotransferase/(S)-3-amino-2-methylpropionate transaminase